MPLGTANGVLYLNGSKVVTSGSGLTFDGTNFTVGSKTTLRSDGPFLTGANLTSGANPLAIGGGAGNSVVAFFVNNAEQMRLTGTGLGIGTNNPVSKLSIIEANRANSTNIGNINVYTSTAQAADVGATISLGGLFSASGYAPFGSIRGGKENSTDNNYAGYLAFQTIPSGGNLTERMRLDASGNLGLGVTPSGWGSPFNALQISRLGMRGSTATAGLSFNTYYDGASFRYIASGLTATDYYQNSGQHVWNIAPSGTAGNAISFSQVMTLDASGNLGIGTTSPLARLHLNDASGGDVPRIRITNGVTGTGATDGMFVGISNSSQLDVWNFENNSIRFATNNAIRAEITGSGNVVIGEAAIPTNATNAFLYVPGCAGTPTGTPTAYTGRVPIVVDTTNNKLYFYSGGQWRDAGP
jgi:hypothetical protein